MALVCGEHKDHDILIGDEIYGALLAGPDNNVAFCERALARVPTDVRYAEEIPDGVNVHTGASKANLGGLSESVSWSDLKYGRRLFSISRADLVRFLPGVAELLLG